MQVIDFDLSISSNDVYRCLEVVDFDAYKWLN
jgi:hypothetical protein